MKRGTKPELDVPGARCRFLEKPRLGVSLAILIPNHLVPDGDEVVGLQDSVSEVEPKPELDLPGIGHRIDDFPHIGVSIVLT